MGDRPHGVFYGLVPKFVAEHYQVPLNSYFWDSAREDALVYWFVALWFVSPAHQAQAERLAELAWSGPDEQDLRNIQGVIDFDRQTREGVDDDRLKVILAFHPRPPPSTLTS